MNPKNFLILVALAVVLAGLAFFGLSRNDRESIAGSSAGSLILPGLAADLDAVDGLEVDGGGNKRLVSLDSDNGRWTVSERDAYTADSKKVNALLIALSEARIVEEKTSDPGFYSRLGVEPIDSSDATGIELTLLAGDSQFAVLLGNTYGSGQRYVRLPDSDQSVLIDKNPDVPRDPADWLLKQIIDVASKRIQRIEIEHADGEDLVISKSSADEMNFAVEDVPEGRELQYASIGNVTGTVLQDLNLEDVERADTGAEAKPVATVEFRTFDGLVVTVASTAVENEDPWLTFSAAFDPEQAAAFAPAEPTAASGGGDESAETGAGAQDGAGAKAETPAPDVAAEAEAINARVSGWQYRIPSYQYSQLTRRMDNLLKAPATEADK